MFSKYHRLELALRSWEDWWFFCKYHNLLFKTFGKKPMFPHVKPIEHYREFREYLWNIIKICSEKENVVLAFLEARDKFCVPKTLTPPHDFFNGDLPICLTSWTVAGRLILDVTPKLQDVLLNATPLEGLKLHFSELPHPSFAVTLQNPLVDAGGRKYDYLLVSRGGNLETGEWNVTIRLFHERLTNYEPISLGEKNDLLKYMKRKNWQRVSNILYKIADRGEHTSCSGTVLVLEGREQEESVENLMNNMRQKFESTKEKLGKLPNKQGYYWMGTEVLNQAVHLTVGLSFHIRTLFPNGKVDLPWQPVPQVNSTVQHPITEGAEFCEL